jgi:RNA polymerase sigma factor (sigma-70 family)
LAAAALALDRRSELDAVVAKNRSKWINAIAKHTGKFELSEDIVQDGIVRALRFLPSFRGDCALSTWVFSIIINQSRQYFREPESRFQFIPINEFHLSFDGAEVAERQRLFEQVMVFVNRLPEREREAVRDYYLLDRWGGKSEPSWQKMRKFRGIQRVRRRLLEHQELCHAAIEIGLTEGEYPVDPDS